MVVRVIVTGKRGKGKGNFARKDDASWLNAMTRGSVMVMAGGSCRARVRYFPVEDFQFLFRSCFTAT